ncbi:NAD(P)H-dependent oxidoreductase [Paludibacterium paludis]|uniref:Dehydrogenase n=1 Tax=Paludibacterium paludis TaxID=1225769 RepID=A0A918P4G7_9NEIS|nr:NAD(P)H-dependent oxidoreductase [Paludibacterium paludis]GGY21808.1 dehydrogenase [Paludibacterium paludis]
MNVLLVYAHPEPRSLNGSIKNFIIRHLEQAGHTVQVSDLYAMDWKAVLDAADNTVARKEIRLDPSRDSQDVYENGTQRSDIEQEQDKLRWADAVILQFPLWWFSMPAILKGWVERVYACGFAYGIGEHSDTRWGIRYGEGCWPASAPCWWSRSVAGHLTMRHEASTAPSTTFSIQHGILFYPGFEVLPPYVVYRTGKLGEAGFATVSEELGQRLDSLWTDAPIPFRKQNAGYYLIPELTLRPDLLPGETGFGIHLDQPSFSGNSMSSVNGFDK